MIARRGCWLILLIGMMAMLTSCWDRHELNEIAIAVGIGLDKAEEGVKVTVQVVNPSEVASKSPSGGYGPPVTVFSATEMTTLEAVRKISVASPRQIFPTHLRILVIGEQLAREGITDLLDGLLRDHQIRGDFYIIVARDARASDVLEILTHIEKIPANRLFTTLEISERIWAPTATIHLDQLIDDLTNPTKGAILTGIRMVGDVNTGKTLKNLEKSKPPLTLQYSGIAIFKGEKQVDWLNEDESKGYNYIMNNVNSSMGHLACPTGGILGVEIIRSTSKVKAKIIRGRPKIHIVIKAEENVNEANCTINLINPKNIQKIEAIAEQDLKTLIEKSIAKAKKNETDIFGFGDAIEDVSPKTWTALKKDWNKEFSELDVTIDVDVKIRGLGTINNSVLERRE